MDFLHVQQPKTNPLNLLEQRIAQAPLFKTVQVAGAVASLLVLKLLGVAWVIALPLALLSGLVLFNIVHGDVLALWLLRLAGFGLRLALNRPQQTADDDWVALAQAAGAAATYRSDGTDAVPARDSAAWFGDDDGIFI